MLCSSCGSRDHRARDCHLQKAQPQARRVCPGCLKAVTDEEYREHKNLGCANVNEPSLRHVGPDA